METRPILPLHDMDKRHFGLTKAIADSFTEAACVCLDRHHRPPTDFQVSKGSSSMPALVRWVTTGDRVRRAWANEIDATEAGAYACALAAVELVDELVAVRRAETKTGADYYVAPKGTSPDDLEDCLRLEVSGVDRGPDRVVRQRLNAKLKQAAEGSSNLPAVAGVVGFQTRLILLAPLER